MPGSRDSQERLDRATIRTAFKAQAQCLAAREVRGHIYVVGGAAMMMAHRRSKSTLGVDAMTIGPREAILEAAE